MTSNKARYRGARTALKVVVISILLIDLGSRPAYSSAERPASKVTDVRFVISGLKVTVTYNLEGQQGAKYDVTLLLRKRSDASFEYTPRDLTGDVGLGEFAGQDRKMTWNMSNEFPQGLEGSDFYFVVNAKEVEAAKSTSLLTWIGAGAAVIAAAVTYVIVMQNRGPGSPPSYPVPPGRPQ